MRPYGIVVYPEEGQHRYPARDREDGYYAEDKYDCDDIEMGTGFPGVMFFQSERGRDAELQALVLKYPGVMFCPITVTTGKKTLPNPQANDFVISNQGILPA